MLTMCYLVDHICIFPRKVQIMSPLDRMQAFGPLSALVLCILVDNAIPDPSALDL